MDGQREGVDPAGEKEAADGLHAAGHADAARGVGRPERVEVLDRVVVDESTVPPELARQGGGDHVFADRVDEVTEAVVGVRRPYCDHSPHRRRPITTSVTSVTSASALPVSSPSVSPKESNWNRFGDSETPLTEEKRWAVTARDIGVTFRVRSPSAELRVDDAGYHTDQLVWYPSMTAITPCLWFDGNGLEAAGYRLAVPGLSHRRCQPRA